MASLPFFYYDILARIIPGAATLAVLWTKTEFAPMDWLLKFVTKAGDSWEKFAVPFVLVGLCYVIGVLYEVVDYLPGLGWISEEIDRRAFLSSVRKFGEESDRKVCTDPKVHSEQISAFRNELWEQLTYKGGSEAQMDPIFAHCQRFQAERKMFLHLLYPT